jgi:hypothetical protein
VGVYLSARNIFRAVTIKGSARAARRRVRETSTESPFKLISRYREIFYLKSKLNALTVEQCYFWLCVLHEHWSGRFKINLYTCCHAMFFFLNAKSPLVQGEIKIIFVLGGVSIGS